METLKSIGQCLLFVIVSEIALFMLLFLVCLIASHPAGQIAMIIAVLLIFCF